MACHRLCNRRGNRWAYCLVGVKTGRAVEVNEDTSSEDTSFYDNIAHDLAIAWGWEYKKYSTHWRWSKGVRRVQDDAPAYVSSVESILADLPAEIDWHIEKLTMDNEPYIQAWVHDHATRRSWRRPADTASHALLLACAAAYCEQGTK